MKKIICTTFSNYDISALLDSLKNEINGIELVSFHSFQKKVSKFDKKGAKPTLSEGRKDFFSVFFDVEDVEITANIIKNNQDIDMDDFQDKIQQNIDERYFLENNSDLIIDVSLSLEDIVEKIKKNTA